MFDFDVRDVHEAREPQTLTPIRAHLRSTDWSNDWSQVRSSDRSQDRSDELAHPIGGIQRSGALMLPPTRTVAEALACFGASDCTVALVASHGYVLGTVTEKQLVRRLLAEPESAPGTPVWRVMQAGPETLKESDSVGYALRKLRQLEVDAMPILHASGRVLGVLGCRDLLHWMGTRPGWQSGDFVGHG